MQSKVKQVHHKYSKENDRLVRGGIKKPNGFGDDSIWGAELSAKCPRILWMGRKKIIS